MDEATWLSSSDPGAMLQHLSGLEPANDMPNKSYLIRLPPSDRKRRLFACACCRQVWDGSPCPDCKGKKRLKGHRHWLDTSGYVACRCNTCRDTGKVGGLTDPRSRRAVEVAERYADGEATEAERSRACQDAGGYEPSVYFDETNPNMAAAWACGQHDLVHMVRTAAQFSGVPPATQAALLRDIFGNPWKPYRIHSERDIDYAWLRWNEGTVPRLAKRIYEERAWHLMPILADALLDADCDNEELLAHCRGEGPHARGCWCLDLLLGRE